jgi:hypothetical protein
LRKSKEEATQVIRAPEIGPYALQDPSHSVHPCPSSQYKDFLGIKGCFYPEAMALLLNYAPVIFQFISSYPEVSYIDLFPISTFLLPRWVLIDLSRMFICTFVQVQKMLGVA